MRFPCILLTLLLMTVGVFHVQAQFRLGIYAGPHFSSVSTESPIEHSGMTAFSAGLVTEYSWENGFRVAFQPGYITKSVMLEGITMYDEVEMRSNYITLPLLLGYEFNMQPVRPYITTGVSVDFLLSAEEKLNGSWYDISDYVKKTDLSLNVGAGVLIPVGSNRAFVEFRYLHGLVNVSDKKGDISILRSSSNYDVMTRGMLIAAGYTFAL